MTDNIIEGNNAQESGGTSCFKEAILNMNALQDIEWSKIAEKLNADGNAIIQSALTAQQCQSLISLYNDDALYRSIINMQRYRFGKGEYKYFLYPLPELIQSLRETFYRPLSKVANTWMAQLNIHTSYPDSHGAFIAHCQSHKQVRPTPLILKYEAGGFNTLHQDLYGEIYFPFQVIIALAQQGSDFEGGELILTEQIPRAQSKAEVIKLNQGDGVIITTNFRPVKGSRGYFRARVKHGVSEVKSGTRYTLGIVFHDAA